MHTVAGGGGQRVRAECAWMSMCIILMYVNVYEAWGTYPILLFLSCEQIVGRSTVMLEFDDP